MVAGNFVNTLDFNPGSGTNNSTSNGSSDIFYLKLNNNGGYLYHKTIGGPTADTCNKIIYDNVNIPYIVGSFRDTVDFNPDAGVNNLTTGGGIDGFVMKINPSSGGLIWVKQFQSNGANAYININDIGIDSQGNIFLGGNFINSVDIDPSAALLFMSSVNLSSGTAQNIFLIKLDVSGNLSDHTTLKPSTSCDLVSLKIDSNDNVISTGEFSGNIDFNPGSGVNQINPNGTTRTFIWKLSNIFGFGFVGSYGGNNANWPYDLYIDSNDAIYVSGQFAGTADFDINSPSFGLTSAGSYDAYFAKVNSNTTFGFAKAVSGFDYNIGKGILVNGTSVFTFGNYKATVDLNSDAGTQNVTSNGDYDFFMQRYTDASLSATSFTNFDFQIYPNPVSSDLSVQTQLENFDYSIYTIEGKKVQFGKSEVGQTTINVSTLPSGMYLIDILSDSNQRSVQKFIKS